jgi:hypothetical protein
VITRTCSGTTQRARFAFRTDPATVCAKVR